MNPGTLVIVNLLGGVALLLWGVRMVRTGIVRGWGDRLKRFIERHLASRATAALAGAGATLFLQSGTAMALIITGLAAVGTLKSEIGLAVLLGADVGSAIATAVFATGGLSLAAWLSPLLLFAGYASFSISADYKARSIGRILMGFGLMLMALTLVTSASAPLREASLFHDVLASIGREPLLACFVGAVVTSLSYSSLAIMLIIASFVANGSLEAASALAFVLGVNFGGGIPALLSTGEFVPAARRLPLANLVCRGLGAAALLPILPGITPRLSAHIEDPVLQVLAAHVGFNIALAIVCLPLASPIMALAGRLLPDRPASDDHLLAPRYLDRMALDAPAVALSNAALESARMAELLDRMFRKAVEALKSGKTEPLKDIRLIDDKLNSYQNEIQTYIAELTQNETSAQDSRRSLEIMLYVSNLEHAGDIIHLSLSDRIKAKIREGVDFSRDDGKALDALIGIVLDSLRLASGVLGSSDVSGARRLIEQKGLFRAIENRIISDQFRNGAARGKTLRRGALFIDLVRDLHTINSHVVSAGYPIADAAGLLRETRLRADEKQ
ncbi:MAG: Na/Pi cotransporter family protein [Pseudomonadota bacterium]|nr:Na/Pi cotransporter family protein [Pseudomonadota bacterium]